MRGRALTTPFRPALCADVMVSTLLFVASAGQRGGNSNGWRRALTPARYDAVHAVRKASLLAETASLPDTDDKLKT